MRSSRQHHHMCFIFASLLVHQATSHSKSSFLFGIVKTCFTITVKLIFLSIIPLKQQYSHQCCCRGTSLPSLLRPMPTTCPHPYLCIIDALLYAEAFWRPTSQRRCFLSNSHYMASECAKLSCPHAPVNAEVRPTNGTCCDLCVTTKQRHWRGNKLDWHCRWWENVCWIFRMPSLLGPLSQKKHSARTKHKQSRFNLKKFFFHRWFLQAHNWHMQTKYIRHVSSLININHSVHIKLDSSITRSRIVCVLF